MKAQGHLVGALRRSVGLRISQVSSLQPRKTEICDQNPASVCRLNSSNPSSWCHGCRCSKDENEDEEGVLAASPASLQDMDVSTDSSFILSALSNMRESMETLESSHISTNVLLSAMISCLSKELSSL